MKGNEDRAVAITDGRGLLLLRGEDGKYSLPVASFVPDSLREVGRVRSWAMGGRPLPIVGYCELLPLPSGLPHRYFGKDELDSPCIDKGSLTLIKAAFCFYPLLFDRRRELPLSPDDLREAKSMLRALARKGKAEAKDFKGLLGRQSHIGQLREAYAFLMSL